MSTIIEQQDQSSPSSITFNDLYSISMDKIEKYSNEFNEWLNEQLSLNDPSLTIQKHESLYNISIIADWFHQIPHFDIKLQQLSSHQNITFDLNDNEYLESLGILVAIPGFWLILTLIFFLIFFLCRCCDNNSNNNNNSNNGSIVKDNTNNHHHHHHQSQQLQTHSQTINNNKSSIKRKSLIGCKLCLAIFTLLSIIVIIISVLGSIIIHNGMVRLNNSTDDIATIIEQVQNNTRQAALYLHDEIDVNIESLKGSVEKMLVKDVAVKANLENQVFFLKRNVSRCMRRVDDIYSRIEKLNLRPLPRTINMIEKIRWPSSFVFALYLLLFCLILFCGLIKHSRCTLILFSVFGLLALVISWVLTSLYFGLLVAGSDFCNEPDSFLDDRFSNEAEIAILDYYIRCRSPPSSYHYQQQYQRESQQQHSHPQQTQQIGMNHPFRVQTRASLIAIDHMSELIRALEMLCISYCNPDQNIVRPQINSIVSHLNSTEKLLKSIQILLDCQRIHNDFVVSMSSTCKNIIEGLFILLITSSLIGLLFTILVLCSSHIWIHIRSIQQSSMTSSTNNLLNTSSHHLHHQQYYQQSGLTAGGSSSLLDNNNSADETDPFLPPSTPRNLSQPHHTILSNNSTNSSLTNTSMTNTVSKQQQQRFRDSYASSAYGTTGRGRFSHTPPQTPHFTTLGGGIGTGNATLLATSLNSNQLQSQPQSTLLHHGTLGRHNMMPRSDEQLAFLSPPPAYDQLNQQQQQQNYQQLYGTHHHHQQQQQQQHSHPHHTGTLPHHHHHTQQQQQHSHIPITSNTSGTSSSLGQTNQSAIGHYMYSSFGHPLH